ncbi:uncharacterized protein LOC107431702 [Ziziphus jujuba]|uniref:Uncharacterized protein LOC107431702 n=1 Tax=Ziziphus jujuba TaxID=326968 RepID=A0A6P4ART0_ZIZJJ|nr:uncharacterized protein LOC107431702 [Ziziphus jujuba]
MTIDDESSIYVGGLPYDATEDSVRRVFDLYGAVVAVKIINDYGTRGKCYGFVTYTNPRSAIDAINDMDGRTIDGRVVKVNEVKTRGGRSRFGRESFRWNIERDRGRDQEREYDHDRERYRNQSDRSRERDRSHNRDQEKEREYEYAYDHDQARSHFLDKGRDQDRNLEDNEQDHSRNHDRRWEREHNLEFNPDKDREMDGTNGHDNIVPMYRNQQSRKWNGNNIIDRHSGEFLSNLSDDYDDDVKAQLERSTQRFEELKKEISLVEARLEEKGRHVLDLQNKSNKLEDALVNAKKNSSYHRMQLTKLHKYFLQVKDYSEKLKSCEKELQSLVDSAMAENIGGDDVAIRGGILTNGNI